MAPLIDRYPAGAAMSGVRIGGVGDCWLDLGLHGAFPFSVFAGVEPGIELDGDMLCTPGPLDYC